MSSKDQQLQRWVLLLQSNDHPRDPKFVAVIVVQRWLYLWKSILGPQNSDRCWQVVVIRRWSLTQVWLYIKFENVSPVLLDCCYCLQFGSSFRRTLSSAWDANPRPLESVSRPTSSSARSRPELSSTCPPAICSPPATT